VPDRGLEVITIQIHELSAQMAHLTTQPNTLHTMNAQLDTLATMDRTLTNVNGRLATTNGLLRQPNKQLAAALVAAGKTNRGLGEMQGRLGTMMNYSGGEP
jgi:hypothetical protein